MVICFGIWANFAVIDVTVSTRGKILTSIPNVSVQSNYSSVLKTVLVKEGDEVKKGQPLALFDETLLASDFRNSQEELSSINKELIITKAALGFMGGSYYQKPIDPLQLAIFDGEVREIEQLRRQLNVKQNLLSYLKNIPSPELKNKDTQILPIHLIMMDTIKTPITIKKIPIKNEVKRLKRLSSAKVVSTVEYEQKAYELNQVQLERDKYLATEISGNFEEVEELTNKLYSLEHEKNVALKDLLQKG